MNALRNILLISIFFSTAATAAPASDNSIKQLFEITQVQKQVDAVRNQVDGMFNNDVQKLLNGKSPTIAQQQAINNWKNRITAITHSVLSWEKFEPIYLRLYKESFTEEDVAGMLSFYKTPAGQALLLKMPVLTQKSMIEVQTILSEVAPNIKSVQEKFVAELKAAQ